MFTIVLLRLSRRYCCWIVVVVSIAIVVVDVVNSDADADDIFVAANDGTPNAVSGLCPFEV